MPLTSNVGSAESCPDDGYTRQLYDQLQAKLAMALDQASPEASAATGLTALKLQIEAMKNDFAESRRRYVEALLDGMQQVGGHAASAAWDNDPPEAGHYSIRDSDTEMAASLAHVSWGLNALAASQAAFDQTVVSGLDHVVGDTELAAVNIIEKIRTLIQESVNLVEYIKNADQQGEAMRREITENAHIIEDLSAFMHLLPEEALTARQNIRVLLERINLLKNQTQSISTIARTTRMIAINAAIEAARAGAHGKCFAVVASEVRKLADDAARTAQSIEQELASIGQVVDTHFSEDYDRRIDEQKDSAARMADSISIMEKSHQDLEFFYGTILSVVLKSNQSLSGLTVEMLGSIQFQDIVRQKIERLQSLLTSHAQLLAATDAGSINREVLFQLETLVTEFLQQEEGHSGYNTTSDRGGLPAIELF